ncbi:SLOG family protein [Streptomyces sp. NPDC127166]|uniref:SLOG family protein n=1 Tax=Streptomyces sp. NPDC127166 TaxID=3345380 RepID=UPI00363CEEB2
MTGSRDWADTDAICDGLDAAVENAAVRGREPVLVVGDCPTGADLIAYRWATAAMVPIDRHYADWRNYGNAAGPRRNIAMVSLGADLCLAFIGPCTSPRCRRPEPHLSHGASGCAYLAENAGIPTRRITA